jgi:hypothetical protein
VSPVLSPSISLRIDSVEGSAFYTTLQIWEHVEIEECVEIAKQMTLSLHVMPICGHIRTVFFLHNIPNGMLSRIVKSLVSGPRGKRPPLPSR